MSLNIPSGSQQQAIAPKAPFEPVNPEKSSPPANSRSKKSKLPKAKTDGNYEPKIKTEPGNSWFQFCRFKKNQAMLESGNKDASYNLKEVQIEWGGMSNDDKAFFC